MQNKCVSLCFAQVF